MRDGSLPGERQYETASCRSRSSIELALGALCSHTIKCCEGLLRSGSCRLPTAAFWKPNSKVLTTRQRSFMTVSILPTAVVRDLHN